MSLQGGTDSGAASATRTAPLKKVDTLCKNITIYGHCRYADKGCMYNHEVKKPLSIAASTNHYAHSNALSEKRLNVDSPRFTPATQSKASSAKGSPLVPSAKIWQPKNTASSPFKPASRHGLNGLPLPNGAAPANVPVQGVQPNPFGSPETNPYHKPDLQDYILPTFHDLSVTDSHGYNDNSTYGNGHPAHGDTYMPTGQDMTSAAIGLYTNNPTFQQQGPQWHLYAPVGPYSDDLGPGQRRLREFFIPDDLRELVQRRMEACNKNLPDSALLPQFDKWHSLVPLDASNSRSTSAFGHPTWIYRATSLEDNRFYALRRVEGIRTADDKALRSINLWKRVSSPHVVKVYEASITRAFGDSSLIFVTDFHPCTKTLAEEAFATQAVRGRKMNFGSQMPEQTLTNYVVQLASAIHIVHTTGLAVRNFDPSKILITDKNHLRLNGCVITDALQQGYRRPATELMLEDFPALGRLILSIGNKVPNSGYNLVADISQFSKSYSPRLREIVTWLMTPQTPQSGPKTAAQFLKEISPELNNTYTMMSHKSDHVFSKLCREVENSRLLRLIFKLNMINERPEHEGNPMWSETGDRYILKLFRDYVWHQVDENGAPVLNLGHVVSCLNKLDVGTDELIKLVSRDEQTCIIVSYKELRKATEAAFADLQKAERQT